MIIWTRFSFAESRTTWCKGLMLCQGGGACLAASYIAKTSTLILSSATACMQALLPPHNRLAMSSSTTQNHHTMARSEDSQTASCRTLDEVLKPLKYLQRRVLLLLCPVAEGWGGGGGGPLRPYPSLLTAYLASWLKRLKRKLPQKKQHTEK